MLLTKGQALHLRSVIFYNDNLHVKVMAEDEHNVAKKREVDRWDSMW